MNRLSSRTVSSDKNYRYLGVEFLYSAEKLKAAHPRHLDIGNNEVYGAPRQYLKGLMWGTKGNDLYVPGGRHDWGELFEENFIIIDKQRYEFRGHLAKSFSNDAQHDSFGYLTAQ